ncbi:alcohol dehydrogenase catalytic domain-containing protein [Curtobacterium sp. VKM Ac-2861]|uniref:alcohol dehydrogenase catalytic domain-containing protein n=1 Tax=unclassified Curtobacterium TaxID=257496 RepID=UPI000F47F06A|nr:MULTISPECIES: alcohol dehydrogenase catalytic domain-containing protein [unclassified Curtobacterium]NQW91234.1 alcohol dehydrogenase catalytic domain-containing protein [Curtobacterium sp. VKM Ac-2861]ROQ17495.1 2-desacetyl-2-hydroxyethyl bacteriochlorophyllide A dehydrogenase [Curtobacterium sp. PhB171]ROQ29260.1 2-desacetyl-2-hydroxyethyl bacteriochlorophyllide A dehydrogenase [Curtobacterium sp. PhB170]ROS36472.1 2-desacetyl-2-hydroxyethyl bacteriochlorophyllide A dehydrogenase [Curtobac
MRAVVLDGTGSIEIADIPAPTPGPNDVVIAPEAVGICGTDIHLASGDYPTGTFPVVPGHEFAGTVTATGAEVTKFAIGDRVSVDPNVNCGHCEECLAGATNLCENLDPIGVTVNGACAEFVAVPEKVVFKLPEGVDWATGALIEPLACVLHAFGRIKPIEGQRVLIYGAGSIGLLALAVAKARGAKSIEIIEPSPVRRDAAIDFGADSAGAPGTNSGVQDIDLVIEASGHPAAVSDALTRLAKRGTLLQMGVVSPTATIDLRPYDLFDRELSIVGSQSLATSYPDAVTEIVTLDDLAPRTVTHTFGLDDYAAALEAAKSESARKVHLLPQQ